MRLTSEEKSVLEALLAAYRKDAEWPTFGALHRLLATEFEAELGDVVSSLFQKLGHPLPRFRWDDTVRLPTRGVLQDSQIEETHRILLRGLPILRDLYLTATEKPRATHQDFLARGWSPSDVWRLHNLCRYQTFWSGMGSTPGQNTWVMDLNPEITRYARFNSAQALWEWIAQKERMGNKNERKLDRARRRRERMASGHHWLNRLVLPILLGIIGTIAAGGILWKLGWA